MFDLGTQELIVIFIVAFLVFGPKKLPELGRNLGRGLRELRRAMMEVKESLEEAGEDVSEEIKEAKLKLEETISTVDTEEAKRGDAPDESGSHSKKREEER